MVDVSREALVGAAATGIITTWNAAAERLFQYRPDEIIGKSFLTLVAADEVASIRGMMDHLQTLKSTNQRTSCCRRKDGGTIPVDVALSPFRDDQGCLIGFAASIREVTGEMDMAAALRASQDRFTSVFQLTPVALSISSLTEGRYLDVNEALLAITGYSREEVVGHTAHELRFFEDPLAAGRLREGLRQEQPLRGMEVRLRSKNGDIRTSLLAADIIDLNNERCLLTATVDITERISTEATLHFLDALGRETAKISEADAILDTTTRMLGEHLKVAVCAYADMDDDEDGFTIRGNWSAPGAASIVGHYRLANFGTLAVDTLRAGKPLVLDDNRAQLPPDAATTFLSIGLAATICLPLVKSGKLTAMMAIHDTKPRAWLRTELTTLIEVTERSWAHIERVGLIEDLRASEARYRGAVITGRIAAWETDMVTRTRIWTEEGMALFGLQLPNGRGQVGGEHDEFWQSLHPDDKHMMAEFHKTADEKDAYPAEYRIVKPDGTMLWVSGRGRVLARATDGTAERVANIVMDITDRKNAETHIQLLMREISHRSKNLLAVIQAIARQTGRSAGSFKEFESRFANRLQGMAASHELLVENDWRGVYLQDLAAQQLALFADIADARRLSMSGPAVMLSAQAAQAIGLALHELGTNAVKFGAWSNTSGNVSVSWDLHRADAGGHVVELTWVERGGPPVTEPARKGFGHIVIDNMVTSTIGGNVVIDYRPSGVIWRLMIPSDQLV
jgi:PAS domain S-box-containing protein